MSTYFPKEGEIVRKWYVVDASGQTLGRLASQVARILMGKENPRYTPFLDTGDHVIVLNAEKVRTTGFKAESKVYQHYTGYPGGLRTESYKKRLDRRPEAIVEAAVKRMLPKNKLAAHMLSWTSSVSDPTPSDRAVVLRVYAVILLSHALLNHVGVRAVTILNWLSAWYHIAVVALLIGALLWLAPKQPAEFLLTRFTREKVPYAYGFLVGLLQAQWTFTGYDASAHVTVETVDGGAPVEVGQRSRVGLPEPSTAIAPLSFLSHRRLSIRPISQLRPPSAAARAPARSRSARARP